MKQRKNSTLLTAALAALLLCSCSAFHFSIPQPEQSPETSTPDSTMTLEKFQDILEGIYYDYTLPNGQKLEFYGDPEPEFPNQFAIFDVDNDGKDELLIRYINTYSAGMFGIIYDYDQNTQTLKQELLEFPALTFYKNGVVEAGWSHNQGLAGRFWPFTLYQYDPDTDIYVELASVDAWDKAFFPLDWDGTPFPDEIDGSGDGIVYYIRSAGSQDAVEPISQQVFTQWWNKVIGADETASPTDVTIEVPYQTLSSDNIANIL